jgi:PIN domain nuclease of toxin-antitoxin system
MKLLLDTHTALWWINENEKLSPKAKSMLHDYENALYLSMASAWEVAIKASTGRFSGLNGGIRTFLDKLEHIPISLVPIMSSHLETLESLPLIHRDPFDRLLVAVAKTDGMAILTADQNIHKYDVPAVW